MLDLASHLLNDPFLPSFSASLPAPIQFFIDLLKPERLMEILRAWGWLAYPLLFAIVFSESGLLVLCFLPGDSLLFIVGFLCSPASDLTGGGQPLLRIEIIIPLLASAAIIGDSVGFWLGSKTGVAIYDRPDGRIYKRKYLIRTQEFYEKHGGKAIVLARFVPIIRTFVPFFAGVAKMNYPRFFLYNIAGGIGWVVSMTALGFFLGQLEIVKKNLEKAVLLVVFLSILPIIIEYWKSRGRKDEPEVPTA